MEKNQNYFLNSLKPAFIAALIISINFASGQKMLTFNNKCGMFFRNMEHLYKLKKDELAFYKFLPGNVVASIGAQCCSWEAAYAATTDSVVFFLEDIDSIKLNFKQAQAAWDYYTSLRGKPMTSPFQIVIGDEMTTHLPDKIFDKIIIINSFHEFTMKKEMLSDIKKKLNKGGILYIDEALPKKNGQLHGVCNLPMLTSKETIDFIEGNGFEFVSSHKFTFRKKTPVREIFAFRLRN